jgi:hypothetical protein
MRAAGPPYSGLNLRTGPDQAYRSDLERSRQRAADLEPIIADLREGGATSLRVPAGALWKATQVRRVVDQYAR